MKNHYVLLISSLLVSLFIYLFYRTTKTVVNELCISLVSLETFTAWRKAITEALPLNEHLIYSLPEGLWVFCITLTSAPFFLKIGPREINLLYLPLAFSIGLELFQLLRLTNGRFDFWDIGASTIGWAIARYFMRHTTIRQNVLAPFTFRSFVCLLSYLIVYLAHVWK